MIRNQNPVQSRSLQFSRSENQNKKNTPTQNKNYKTYFSEQRLFRQNVLYLIFIYLCDIKE